MRRLRADHICSRISANTDSYPRLAAVARSIHCPLTISSFRSHPLASALSLHFRRAMPASHSLSTLASSHTQESRLQQLKTNRVELFATATELIGPLAFSLATPDTLPANLKDSASTSDVAATSSATPPPVDCAVLFVTEEQASSQSLPLSSLGSLVSADSLHVTATQWSDFTAKAKQTLFLYPAPSSSSSAPSLPRLLLVGLGRQSAVSVSTLRSATHTMVAALKAKRVRHVVLVVPDGEVKADEEGQKAGLDSVLDALVRIAVLSDHKFAKYVTLNKDGEKAHQLEHVTLVHPSFTASSSSYGATVKRSATIAECTLFSRDLANDRADTITPSAMEAIAQKVATTHQLPFTVVKGDALHTEGLTLIEAVGQGSRDGEKARILVLRYVGDTDNQDCIALVGKTITFDTGGLNMKHTGNIEDMYCTQHSTLMAAAHRLGHFSPCVLFHRSACAAAVCAIVWYQVHG